MKISLINNKVSFQAQGTNIYVFCINNRALGFLFPSNPRLLVIFFIFWCYIFSSVIKMYMFFGCVTNTISMLPGITNVALDPQTLVCRTFTRSPTNALNPFYFLPLYLSHFSFVLGYRKANWRWPTMGKKMQAKSSTVLPKPISSIINRAHKRNVSGNYSQKLKPWKQFNHEFIITVVTNIPAKMPPET